MKRLALLIIVIAVAALSMAAESGSSSLPKYLHNVSSDDAPQYVKRVDTTIKRTLTAVVSAFPLPHMGGGHTVVISFGQSIGEDNQVHLGLDIGTPIGTPVMAAGNGTIVLTGFDEDDEFGNYVVIDHGNYVKTIYGHLSSFAGLHRGATVRTGGVIGYSGITGWVTDEALHFEIVYRERYVDPAIVLERLGELK